MQNKVYDILKSADDFVSGQEISKQLGVSRQAVWKAINALKEQGFVIESVTNRGYRLADTPKILCRQIIEENLTTNCLGREIIILESTPSTNDELKALARKGAKSGAVVIGREQTAGKGRLGRQWLSKKDENITFSLLLRPKLSPMEVTGVTPLVGLAVCKALREFCNTDCKIKWPNDVILNNKKLVGILTEMSAEFDAVEYIVIGIGINVDQADFPEEVKCKATSVFLETGRKIDKNKFVAALLNTLERELEKSGCKINESNIEDYKSLCATVGRTVTFYRDGEALTGKATDINARGELVISLENGESCCVNSGEVTIQGIY